MIKQEYLNITVSQKSKTNGKTTIYIAIVKIKYALSYGKRHFLLPISPLKILNILCRICLEGPMDRGAWWAAVHRVTGSQTRLSDFTFTFHFHALEKEMATHSSLLAWRIPGTGEPGGLPSMESHRVRHD